VVRGGHLDSAAVLRFREERQILAELEHPNIARLVDGGTSAAGLPYLVMEHVDGSPIDVYCDARRLPVDDRLALFCDVCAAVQHAHQRLVVHRDIKASNVLVTEEGEAKLLDFGIAKLMVPDGERGPLTLTGERLLTPESASPEQVRGESLTTASDVYQLGALLHRLLAGRTPYAVSSSSPAELARAICEQEPDPASVAATLGADAAERSALRGGLSPARLRRRLSGDLDVIIAKALRKEPERRYVTVAALADDVRRHLAGLPVLARVESVWYRAGKLAVRHKVGAAGLALVFLTLAGGLAATTWQARVARAERERAARRFDEVRQLAHDSLFELHDAIRELPGSMPARALIVRKGLAYLDRLAAESGDDPALTRELADAYDRLGDIQGGFRAANLGDTGGALDNYRHALGMRESLLRAAPAGERPALQRDVAASHAKLGALLFARGETVAARHHLDVAVAGLEPLADERNGDPQAARILASAETDLGYLMENAGDPAAAVVVYRRAEARWERARAGAADERSLLALIKVRSRLARALAELPGKRADALRLESEAVAEAERLAAARPTSAELQWTAMMQHAVEGIVAHRLDQRALARADYERAIAAGERLLAADPENAQWRHDLALSYALAGNLAAEQAPGSAMPLLDRALQLGEPMLQRDPADVGAASVVAMAQAGLGRAHAGLALTAAAGPLVIVDCQEAVRWQALSAPVLAHLSRLQTLSGWERWLAQAASAAVDRCGAPAGAARR
jgi:non-specific serine/threonine protein kinase/serine/threonine-protein kinase